MAFLHIRLIIPRKIVNSCIIKANPEFGLLCCRFTSEFRSICKRGKFNWKKRGKRGMSTQGGTPRDSTWLTMVCLPWKHLVKKFICFGFLALQLLCSFIYDGLQIVGVFFHHREHVVYHWGCSGIHKMRMFLLLEEMLTEFKFEMLFSMKKRNQL